MNQTIHAHQIIHAFNVADAKECRRHSNGKNGARPETGGANGKLRMNARRIAAAAIMVLPLMATELLLGEVASEGWLAGIVDQTSQLLALASPF